MRRFASAILCAGAVTCACSPDDARTEDRAPSHPRTSAHTAPDACSLLTLAEAEAILGRLLGDPSGYTDGGKSMCTYAAVDTDTTVTVELWMRRQPASSAEFARMVVDGEEAGGRVEPVEDLGGPAAWHDFGSGAINLWLDVFEHTARADYRLRVESGSLAAAKALAEKALGRLP
jgi:hypothetical protein